MNFKKLIPVLLAIGLILGGMFTQYKFLIYIGIFILVTRGVREIAVKSFSKIKESKDKRMATRNEAVKGLNYCIEYTEFGHELGADIFRKVYPRYILVLNLILAGATVWSLYVGLVSSAITFFLFLNVFIVLNQIWRNLGRIERR